MSYKRIGVVGATGLLGQEVTRALIEAEFDVVPLSRQKETVAGVPTQDITSFAGFDAIVSTVGHGGMSAQLGLITQAKKDGVKRFVPSEFGVDHRITKADFFRPKIEVLEAVKEAEFPDGWTAIASGFLETTIPQFLHADSQLATITVQGQGEKEFPFSSRHDLGRVLAHTFKHPSEYKDTWLTIANGWYSLNQFAQIVCEESYKGFSITHAELTGKTPVLQLLEAGQMEIFDRNGQTCDIPVAMTDLKEYVRHLRLD